MTYEEHLYNLIKDDERFIVLTSENRSSIRGLPDLIKGRFIDTGISEQTLIGVSAGLALRKRIPLIHAIGAFITMRAFEFIRTDIAYPNLPIKTAATFTGFLSEGNGPTHQAVEDLALMRTMPNMIIFCPADELDLLIGLKDVIHLNKPCYIRLNHLPPAYNHSINFEIGKAEVCHQSAESCKVTLLTYGTLFKEAVKTYKILEEYGITVRLINMRFLQPVDEVVLVNSCYDSELIVTIEDHYIYGGLYSILCELFVRKGIIKRVLPFALENKWFAPSYLDRAIQHEGLAGEIIANKIIKQLGGTNAEQG